ncbi:ribonuclease T2 [Sarracenia purpurea var. burkii]
MPPMTDLFSPDDKTALITWPGSYCDTRQRCCFPSTGKPASNFSIHGLWPNYNDGSYPSYCDPDNPFDQSQVLDLTNRMKREWPSLGCPSSSDGSKLWAHEWNKHGTCSESILNQHDYFRTALNLKNRLNLLQILTNAGIKPNGQQYSLESIEDAIRSGGTEHSPWIQCNLDPTGNSQLYQIYQCIDASGSTIIDCPVPPSSHQSCAHTIEFPPF